tara:strand:+ start:156 stop:362 length:207 start_codon:yes stop_codon:yes gene_type:complete
MYEEYGRQSPPVNEGEEVNVMIEGIGREGDGIAKVENFVVFVPKTEVGENIDVRITKVTKNCAFGERL